MPSSELLVSFGKTRREGTFFGDVQKLPGSEKVSWRYTGRFFCILLMRSPVEQQKKGIKTKGLIGLFPSGSNETAAKMKAWNPDGTWLFSLQWSALQRYDHASSQLFCQG